jgi:tetratricopeptide (TPR) repeat protein
MHAFLKSPPQRIAMALALAASVAVGFVPLFGGPGYEAALAAGLILPALAACATAAEVVAFPSTALGALGRGALSGAALALVALAVSVLHGLRVGFCDPAEGIAFFLLGPGLGAIFGGMWGAGLGLGAGALGVGRLGAVLGALLGPIAGIVVSLVRFYTSPMVFAFDPFFGFFAGTLYDTVISGLHRLVTYRAGTALSALALVVAAAFVRRDPDGRLGLERRPLPLGALGVVAAAGSIAHAAYGPELGHYQTTATIREALGHSALSDRCEVLYPGAISRRDAHALARECDGHVEQLEKYFEVEAPRRTTVFVFESSDQKGRLMGAAQVFIAKPWREEIYIQGAGYPHRVLRHELAHVVAGRFARGPFLVAGPLGGFIPDPGRIEGVAVAAAPREDELGLQQWAEAMRRLDLLPRLDRVFRLSFLGEPSSRAYTVAGAFVQWFMKEHGAETLARWYRGEPLEAVTGGKSLAALERSWHNALLAVKVSEEAMHVAKARFDQPAIFGRRCPHAVDRLGYRAGWLLGRLDVEQARRMFGDVLALDPHNIDAQLGLGDCALRDGKASEALEQYDRIAKDERFPRAIRARAREAIGDVSLAGGDPARARQIYDEVARTVVDEDRLRALDVKRYAATHEAGRDAIVGYLIGDAKRGRDDVAAAAALGAWSAADPKLGLADYLLGRSLFGRGRWEEVARRLDCALSRTLPIPSVAREATRSRMVLACAFGDRAGVEQLWSEIARDRGLAEARRAHLAEVVERCLRKSGGRG